jgi:hypothetical protein
MIALNSISKILLSSCLLVFAGYSSAATCGKLPFFIGLLDKFFENGAGQKDADRQCEWDSEQQKKVYVYRSCERSAFRTSSAPSTIENDRYTLNHMVYDTNGGYTTEVFFTDRNGYHQFKCYTNKQGLVTELIKSQ